MNNIGINNLSDIDINEKRIKQIVSILLKKEGIKDKELSVVFLTKDSVRQLNKKYRNSDRATDVLSFEGENDFLGEIAISPQIVLQRSTKNNFTKNIAQTLIHGILHLLKYDHIKKADREKMREKEKVLFLNCKQYLNNF